MARRVGRRIGVSGVPAALTVYLVRAGALVPGDEDRQLPALVGRRLLDDRDPFLQPVIARCDRTVMHVVASAGRDEAEGRQPVTGRRQRIAERAGGGGAQRHVPAGALGGNGCGGVIRRRGVPGVVVLTGAAVGVGIGGVVVVFPVAVGRHRLGVLPPRLPPLPSWAKIEACDWGQPAGR